MIKILLVLLCCMMPCLAAAGSLKTEIEALYRPVDAETIKLMTFLPPRVSDAAATQGGSGGRCPQNINIGSVQGQENRLQRFDSIVIVKAPIVIQCR
jgi:hypothetical protein